MDKSKQFLKQKKRSFRRRLSPIQSGDRIDYRNMRLISQFISEHGKILSRKRTRLTLKQQRLITIAIKQARILSSLPFLNNAKLQNEKQLKNNKWVPRTPGRSTLQNEKQLKNNKWVPRTPGRSTLQNEKQLKNNKWVPRTPGSSARKK